MIKKYRITNKNGAYAEILNYGGIINKLMVPDSDGKLGNVVLGFDNVEDYIKDDSYQGALIGRYANRIWKGKFTLNGKEYNLVKNENNVTTLHGNGSFNKSLWDVSQIDEHTLKLSFFSPDGEYGFPGNLKVEVIYEFDNNNFKIKYNALSDKDTIINFTNHSYFNLSGDFSKTILNHEMKINANYITPINEHSIPTGFLDVTNTPMDFRTFKKIGKDINSEFEQIKLAKGYDHTYVINNDARHKCVELFDQQTKRHMAVSTNKPGVQIYTGNFLDGKPFIKNAGVAIETGFYPNTPNTPKYPSCVFKANELYNYETTYKFSIREE